MDLRLWIDIDRDGRSTQDEISTLEDWGIDEIDLDWRYELTMDGSSNFFRAATEFRSRGQGGPSKGRHPVRGRILEVELARTRPLDRVESPQGATP